MHRTNTINSTITATAKEQSPRNAMAMIPKDLMELLQGQERLVIVNDRALRPAQSRTFAAHQQRPKAASFFKTKGSKMKPPLNKRACRTTNTSPSTSTSKIRLADRSKQSLTTTPPVLCRWSSSPKAEHDPNPDSLWTALQNTWCTSTSMPKNVPLFPASLFVDHHCEETVDESSRLHAAAMQKRFQMPNLVAGDASPRLPRRNLPFKNDDLSSFTIRTNSRARSHQCYGTRGSNDPFVSTALRMVEEEMDELVL